MTFQKQVDRFILPYYIKQLCVKVTLSGLRAGWCRSTPTGAGASPTTTTLRARRSACSSGTRTSSGTIPCVSTYILHCVNSSDLDFYYLSFAISVFTHGP